MGDDSMEMIQEIIDQGENSFWGGIPACYNPYPRKSIESKSYAYGWRIGRRDEKDIFGKNYVPIEEKKITS
jgi:hypothetical protein